MDRMITSNMVNTSEPGTKGNRTSPASESTQRLDLGLSHPGNWTVASEGLVSDVRRQPQMR